MTDPLVSKLDAALIEEFALRKRAEADAEKMRALLEDIRQDLSRITAQLEKALYQQ